MMKNLKILISICIYLLPLSFLQEAKGQQSNVYSDMSLDELLNVDVVVTASKKPEDLFETPLSTTIIKKEDILKSGATSIPEALRLSPGLIVREITPGNYDVHIRGYDDITKNVYLTLPYNTSTLVMIDNRIVYSYFTGGTFWETIPIDISDIERIEVVRGPASALYGPNAVTGVINIITSHANKKGINSYASGTLGTQKAKNANLNVGYNWNDKTKLSFSANFSERHRFSNDFFDNNKNAYTSLDNLSMLLAPVKNNASKDPYTFPEFQKVVGAWYDESISLRKTGGNVFLHHQFSDQFLIDASAGAQTSQSIKTGFLNLVTPLSQIESESYYVNTQMKYKNLKGQFNAISGQDFSNYKFNSYKYSVVDATLEYYKQINKVSLRPGVTFNHINYNSPLTYEEPFNLSTLNYAFKDEPRISSSYSASLLSEWTPNSKLRFIGAGRVDKFTINKNYFFTYEFAATYRINKNNLLRLVYAKANKSPFIFDSYLNCLVVMKSEYRASETEDPISIPVDFAIHGSKDLKYPTNISREIGWRTKLSPSIDLDIEYFYSKVNNFVNPSFYKQYTVVRQFDSSGENETVKSAKVKGDVIFENDDLVADQTGVTFMFNYTPGNNLSIWAFGTYQKTQIFENKANPNGSTYIQIGDVNPDNTMEVNVNSVTSPTEWSENLTPSLFGGFFINYNKNKWNFNTDAYIYSNQTFTNFDYQVLDREQEDGSTVTMDIKTNMILNGKVKYHINNNISTSVTFKNILGKHREYGFADQIGRVVLIGVQWEL